MPSLFTSRRISSVLNNNAQTLGEIRKEQSDWAMEELWDFVFSSKALKTQFNFGSMILLSNMTQMVLRPCIHIR